MPRGHNACEDKGDHASGVLTCPVPSVVNAPRRVDDDGSGGDGGGSGDTFASPPLPAP